MLLRIYGIAYIWCCGYGGGLLPP